MNEEPVQVFVEDGGYPYKWGWQCFLCREEQSGFGNATTAREGADNHAAVCGGTP